MKDLRSRWGAMVVVVGVVSAACGGGGPGPGSISAADAEELCERRCTAERACNPSEDPLEACTADCADDLRGIRGDVFEDYVDCVEGLACGANDDACVTCTPTAVHRDYEARCRAKLPTCGVDAEGVDETCTVTSAGGEPSYACILGTEVIADLIDCLAIADCEQAEACFGAVLETVDI
ncbi:MAG: hypothetical protein R2939_10270 [Kofleriaceae bacterium]